MVENNSLLCHITPITEELGMTVEFPKDLDFEYNSFNTLFIVVYR